MSQKAKANLAFALGMYGLLYIIFGWWGIAACVCINLMLWGLANHA